MFLLNGNVMPSVKGVPVTVALLLSLNLKFHFPKPVTGFQNSMPLCILTLLGQLLRILQNPTPRGTEKTEPSLTHMEYSSYRYIP